MRWPQASSYGGFPEFPDLRTSLQGDELYSPWQESFLPHLHTGVQFSLSSLDPVLRLQLEVNQLLFSSSWLAPHAAISLGWWALMLQPTGPHTRPGTRQLRTAFLPYTTLTWLELANPKPA